MKSLSFIGKIRNKRHLSVAVKEALDTLPTAVCYFTSTGTVKLCNTSMYELFRKIAQCDLQSLSELNEALKGCDKSTGIIRDKNVFLFPNGSAWQYFSQEIVTADGEAYTEVLFSDVTQLYEKRCELHQQSRELKKMYKELETLSENAMEIAKEQEVLNLKSRLHDRMNMGVSAIRQILRQNTTSKENDLAVKRFRRAVEVLNEENAYPQDDVSEFVRDASISGIELQISGELPKEKDILRILLPVMREACVNAARHANAATLYIEVQRLLHAVCLRIKNDGKKPESEIIPRGGLVDLIRLIKEADGKIEIKSQPEFVLEVTLPTEKLPKEG